MSSRFSRKPSEYLQTGYKKSIKQQLDIALNYQQNGKYELAISVYKKLLSLNIKNDIIFMNLGLISKRSGEIDDAINYFESASKFSRSKYEAHWHLAELYYAKKEHSLSLKCLNVVLSKGNATPRAYLLHGVLQKELLNFDQAISSTKAALSLDLNCFDAYLNLVDIYKLQGMINDAILIINDALSIRPDEAKLYFYQGQLYSEVGDFSKAISSTICSIDKEPTNPIFHIGLAKIFKHIGQVDKALDCITAALSFDSNFIEAYLERGNIFLDMGNYPAAGEAFHQALHYDSSNPSAIVCVGRLAQITGEITTAKNQFETALRYNSNEVFALFELSYHLNSKTEAEKLLSHIKSVNSINFDSMRLSKLHFAHANCLHFLGQYKQSSDLLLKANGLKLQFQKSDIDYHLDQISRLTSIDYLTPLSGDISSPSHIFLVGAPRCGSTLLSVVLCTNPLFKSLGESKAISSALQELNFQPEVLPDLSLLPQFYAKNANIDPSLNCITLDKMLYNFAYSGIIASYLPGARIIHCVRNPLDIVLSMYRSNLTWGNNYSSSIEDAARFVVAHHQAMQFYKNRFPQFIYSFDYDAFVQMPEPIFCGLAQWLGIDIDQFSLSADRSSTNVNTASVISSRRPISSKSLYVWRHYHELLMPAMKIFEDSGLPFA